MQLPSYAGRADTLCNGLFQMPAATAAERRRISLDLCPTLGTHKIIYAGYILKMPLADEACLRIDNIRQVIQEPA